MNIRVRLDLPGRKGQCCATHAQVRSDLSYGTHSFGCIVTAIGEVFCDVRQRRQKWTVYRDDAQIRAVDRSEQADCIGHTGMIRKEQNGPIGWNVFPPMYAQIMDVMLLQKSTRGVTQSCLPDEIVILHDLLSKLPCRA